MATGYGASAPYTANLTPGQKAAATRRANRAAGIPPKSTARRTTTRGGPAFATAKPTFRGAILVALSAIEDAFFLKQAEVGVTPEARGAFATYEKVKALALGQTSSTAAQTEADSALRMAVVHLAKLTF